MDAGIEQSQMSCDTEDEDLGESSSDLSEKVKLRDLDCVLKSSQGMKTMLIQCSKSKEAKSVGDQNVKEGTSRNTAATGSKQSTTGVRNTILAAKPLAHHSVEEGTSQITEAAGSMLSDRPEHSVISNTCLGPNGSNLTLRVSTHSSGGSFSDAESIEIIGRSGRSREPYKAHETNKMSTAGLSSDQIDNPFYPYKKLGKVRSVDASECGSTTGPLEESDPLRVWNAMKQNGFLSSSHGGIPIPKQRGRQPKRKKDDEIKKKSDVSKREQANKYTKIASPTGLLSGLNPGIVKHVRNSKQVNNIIKTLLQSEEDQMQNRLTNQLFERGRENQLFERGREKQLFERGRENSNDQNCASYQPGLSMKPTTFPSCFNLRGEISESDMTRHKAYHDNSVLPHFNSDDTLRLKLSSAVNMASENASIESSDEVPSSQATIACLSLKAATVASQWLDLLQQDIKGRLAALRRSKRRVRNVVQTELPYLLSKDVSSNHENEPNFGHSSEDAIPSKEILDMHMARWKSIFSQMEKALYEEGKHLESWLKQVQDMHSHCERGLKNVGAHGLSELGQPDEYNGLKKTEAVENEYAIKAAAASIYSTCNFIRTKENVPCF